MRLERLVLSEFRSYQSLELELGSLSCAAIQGRNGAGKSSLLTAIDWCLFGTGSADALLREGASVGFVSLEFSIGDERYKVTRGREREKKSWLTLGQPAEDSWATFAARTIAETQERIVAVLGLTAGAFRASIYSPQGQAGVLAAMTAGDRKSLLGGLLGLSRYEEWRSLAAADARAHSSLESSLKPQAVALALKLSDLQRDQVDEDELRERIEQARETLAGFGVEYERAQQRAEARQQIALRAELVAQMDELKAQSTRLGDQRREIGALGSLQGAVEAARGKVDRLRTAAEAARTRAAMRQERKRSAIAAETDAFMRLGDLRGRHVDIARQIKQVTQRREALAAQLLALRDEDARCFACGQVVGSEEIKRLRDRLLADNRDLRRELVSAEQDADRCAVELKDAEDAYVRAQAAVDEFGEHDPPGPDPAPLLEAEGELERARAETARLEALAEQLRSAPSSSELKQLWGVLEGRIRGLVREVTPGPTVDALRTAEAQIRERLSVDEQALARAASDHERALELQGELESIEDEIESERERAQTLNTVARAFSRDGIPALILDGAVAGVESSANEVLAGLGSAFKVRLATQRALKSAKGMAETLEILVDDGLSERELGSFSGGERYRVNLALRLGLAAALGGQAFGVLLIDEVTDLDTEGTQTLAQTLIALAPERQVLVVSHDPALADAMPERVSVTRRSSASPSELIVA